MTIPLDKLYHFIEGIIEDIYGDVIIYRFFPHGSKKFSDLLPLSDIPINWKSKKILPQVFCNDQEPLDYDYYEASIKEILPTYPMMKKFQEYGIDFPNKNFRTDPLTIWDHAILLHSEQRSINVEKYKNCDFLPVYYWSHAVIARDWFRYAEHVRQNKQVDKLFLIYSRGWTHTREYRLKFLESVALSNLHKDCKVNVQPTDSETNVHYTQHKFLQDSWRPAITLEDYFAVDTICPTRSADFDQSDYESTDIEVVLETLFDDERLHFTEKILRPMALAQPFILVGNHGGLEYLRSYGFKTFSSVWSEDYDTIKDPQQRMQAVVKLMQDIKAWSPEQKQSALAQAQEIANYNKKLFFSRKFFDQVTQELKNNLVWAFEELENENTSQFWIDFKTNYGDHEIQKELARYRTQQQAEEVLELAMQYHHRHK